MKIILITVLVSVFSFARSQTIWPTENWERKSLEDSGFDREKFQQFENYLFDEEAKYQTNGVVIIKDGYLVYEKYNNGYDQSKKHLLWSIAKSITGTLVSIAENQGLLSYDDLVSKYVDVPSSDFWQSVTIQNFLNMSSGLGWREEYENDPTNSDIVNILYGPGRFDFAQYTKNNVPYTYAPNANFYYSSGDSGFLMHLLRGVIDNDSVYHDFPFVELFEPIGITDATFEKDNSGNFYGASHIYLRPRDLARFGYLYLHHGQWNGRQIFGESWNSLIQEIAPAWYLQDNPHTAYSAQWWLNKAVPSKMMPSPYPNAPENILMGFGHHGQRLIIFPGQNMILVRMGWDKEDYADLNRFSGLLMESLN